MQTMWFPAWFFKTKLDNVSGGCAAFYHSLSKERIENAIDRNGISPRYSRTQAQATGQTAHELMLSLNQKNK